tara:strand:- start:702 stop:1319 length:618 start_codon:yes stop_codon:yes gene_type:complete
MPNWKKLIVSGSDANLNSLNITTDLTGSNALITNDLDVLGNVTVGTGIGVGTTTIYSNSINLNNSGTVRIGNAEFLSKSSNDLSIYQNKITIQQGGNVGIGNTSPSYNLVVGDGTTDTESRFYHNDASYTSVRGFGLYMSRTNSYIRPINDGSQTLYIGTDSKTWGTLSADANTFTLNRDGNSRLYINSAGNVGIGTTSPVLSYT